MLQIITQIFEERRVGAKPQGRKSAELFSTGNIMSKSFGVAVAISLASATAALAGGTVAPLVETQPLIVAPVSAPSTWTGFYAGLQYGQGSTELSGGGVSVDFGDFDALGLHAGYARDLGQFVVGGELNYDSVEFDDFSGTGDLWRLRGRVGYNMGQFQPYVTLGLARLSGDDLSENGITYGIGAEYLVNDKFSFGLEYSHTEFTDFLEDDLGFSGIDFEADLVQIRASYRF